MFLTVFMLLVFHALDCALKYLQLGQQGASKSREKF